jgi:DeoR/GlpR family transcriptional regulator of sugar metabolism
LILEQLQEEGTVIVADLCERFGVSDMTIRRDLRDLDREGLLRRIHGGAVSNLGRGYEPPFTLRTAELIDEKRAIGARAAEMIRDGDTIGLDFGSTTLEIVRALEGTRDLTIVTGSLSIANEVVASMSLDSNVRLVLTGGVLRSRELSMIGNWAEEAYQRFHVDKAFIGVGALSLENGLTDYNLEDAEVKLALIKSARRSIVVVDHTKLGRTKFASVAPLSAIETLITDDKAPDDIIQSLREMDINVVIA